jgi:hypothetical protein
MGKFTKFSDWEKTKYSANEENEQKATTQENAELLAQIGDLVARRKDHIKRKDDFEAQILDIDIKLLRLDVEKNDLIEKRKHLSGAKEIAATRRVEGKRNDDKDDK